MSKKTKKPAQEVVKSTPKNVRSIRLTERMWDELSQIAAEEQISPSEAIRHIISMHLVRREYDRQVLDRLSTVEERVADLADRMADLLSAAKKPGQ